MCVGTIEVDIKEFQSILGLVVMRLLAVQQYDISLMRTVILATVKDAQDTNADVDEQ